MLPFYCRHQTLWSGLHKPAHLDIVYIKNTKVEKTQMKPGTVIPWAGS